VSLYLLLDNFEVTFLIFSNLIRLKDRIDELHVEIDQAKDDFKLLHKERGVLLKECEHQKEEIQIWSERCTNLQILKFGRCVLI